MVSYTYLHYLYEYVSCKYITIVHIITLHTQTHRNHVGYAVFAAVSFRHAIKILYYIYILV